MNIGAEYIKYRWNAKTTKRFRHSIAGKIFYSCFNITMNNASRERIKNYYNRLVTDNSSINFKDFGAGSKKLSTKRKISQIIKTSSSKGKYGKLLFQLSSKFEPKEVLELGTSLGFGTINLFEGFKNTKITTVEADPETFNRVKQAFKEFNYSINCVNDTFENYLSQLTSANFDIVFIDGHHDGKALLKYLEMLEPFTNEKTIYILDDIRWSSDMLKAWNNILNSNKYNTSIDLFRMGIVTNISNGSRNNFTFNL